jgi:hypothetical protein
MIKFIALILPWEVNFLPKIVSQLIACKTHLSDEDCKNIKFSICYSNVPEQINWDESSAIPQHSENVFNKCCKLLSQYYNVTYTIDNNVRGCVGHRRVEFNKNDYDFCVTFDADMNFPSTLLSTIITTSKIFKKDEILVFTPQTSVMWDETWKDVCAFDLDLREQYWDRPERFNIELIQPKNSKFTIKQIGSKWYGGMFPCYSRGYLKEYPLHEKLGDGYGPDDYYLMLKGLNGDKKHKQYVIEGVIVENSKRYYGLHACRENYKFNYYAKKISDDDLYKLIASEKTL